jgi:hypothetical protein
MASAGEGSSRVRRPSKIARIRAAEIIAMLAGGSRSLTDLLAIAYERGLTDAAEVLGKINDR